MAKSLVTLDHRYLRYLIYISGGNPASLFLNYGGIAQPENCLRLCCSAVREKKTVNLLGVAVGISACSRMTLQCLLGVISGVNVTEHVEAADK